MQKHTVKGMGIINVHYIHTPSTGKPLKPLNPLD